jgi:hypothetical protein
MKTFKFSVSGRRVGLAVAASLSAVAAAGLVAGTAADAAGVSVGVSTVSAAAGAVASDVAVRVDAPVEVPAAELPVRVSPDRILPDRSVQPASPIVAPAASPVVAAAAVAAPLPDISGEPGVKCVTGDPKSPEVLNEFFSADDAAGISGSDYPHAFELGDGRILWMFQDVFLGSDSSLWDDGFAHNTGLVQVGQCFKPIAKPAGKDWVRIPESKQLTTWLWPMDGELGVDGMFHLFFVEMHNPTGRGAYPPAAPQSTWHATIDPVSLEVLSVVPAADSSGELFGWSIVTDAGYSYMFGHCYEQFTGSVLFYGAPVEVPAHQDCAKDMKLARVPAGEFGAALEYWDGAGFVADAAAAAVVADSTDVFLANPMQVSKIGDRFVAVSKIDDWFGAEVKVYESVSVTGPFVEVLSVPTVPGCDVCNTYGAFMLPWADPSSGQVIVAISNNAWDMNPVAFNDASLYRPSFFTVPV